MISSVSMSSESINWSSCFPNSLEIAESLSIMAFSDVLVVVVVVGGLIENPFVDIISFLKLIEL